MKINNLNLVEISNLFEKYSNKRFPQKISYAITKNNMIIKNDLECYTTELQKIFEVFKNDYMLNEQGETVVDNTTGLPVVKPERQEEFFTQINQLLSIEIDIELYKIDSELFNYDDEGKYDLLTPAELMQLQEILCNN